MRTDTRAGRLHTSASQNGRSWDVCGPAAEGDKRRAFQRRGPRGVAVLVLRATGARSAIIQWRHLDGAYEMISFSHLAAACAALYAWRYAPIDPWVNAALAAGRPGELLCMDE